MSSAATRISLHSALLCRIGGLRASAHGVNSEIELHAGVGLWRAAGLCACGMRAGWQRARFKLQSVATLPLAVLLGFVVCVLALRYFCRLGEGRS